MYNYLAKFANNDKGYTTGLTLNVNEENTQIFNSYKLTRRLSVNIEVEDMEVLSGLYLSEKFPIIAVDSDLTGFMTSMGSDLGVYAMFGIALSHCSENKHGEYHIWSATCSENKVKYPGQYSGHHPLESTEIKDVPELMQEPGWYEL